MLKRNELPIYMLAGAWGLGRMGCFHLGGFIWLCVSDVVLALFVLFYVAAAFKEKSRFSADFARPLLLFTGIAAFSLLASLRLFAPSDIMAGGLYLLRWLALGALPFAVIGFTRKTDSEAIGRGLWFLAGIVAIAGIIQFIFLPNIGFLESEGWDPHFFRVVSTFLDPNFTGGLMTLALLLAFSKQLEIFSRRDWMVSALLYLVLLLLTFSRSSYAAFAVGMIVLMRIHQNKLFTRVAVISILILTVAWIPRTWFENAYGIDRTASGYARIVSWSNAIQIISKHPMLGIGFNNYRIAQEKYLAKSPIHQPKYWHSGSGSDSSILLVWATTGVFGLGAYLWFLYTLFRRRAKGTYSTALVASTPALLFHATFVNSLFYPPIIGWMLLLAGGAHAKETMRT